MQRARLFAILGLLMSGQGLWAQSFAPRALKGRVYGKDGDAAAIHVRNTSTKKGTITDVNGCFTIWAHLNDTLVFSAVQYKRKEVSVSLEMLERKFVLVPLEAGVTQLEEVVVRPYGLSGDMARDADLLEIDPVITAATLELPNAYVRPPSQTKRLLLTATNPKSLDRVFNAISGRTKKLKNRLRYERTYARTKEVRTFYKDSVIARDLRIPKGRIADFLYYCEVDSRFQKAVSAQDRLKIWEVMRIKSRAYRRNNNLD